MKLPQERPLVGSEFIAVMTGAETDCETLCRSLKTRGYTTFRSCNPEDILCLIDTAAVSVLIISETSPISASQNLCRVLKNTKAQIPIIVLHNGLDLDARINWIKIGADHCAQQPVKVDELIMRIRVITRRLGRTPVLT